MSDQSTNRFAPQNKTTQERLSTTTVGLVALSDFRKRRAEVLEQQERESREATGTGTGTEASTPGAATPDSGANGEPSNGDADNNNSGGSGGPPVKKKSKKKKTGKKLLSFGDDEDDEDGEGATEKEQTKGDGDAGDGEKKSKFKANASVAVAPKAMTKAALRKEATERETLRREFLAIREAVKATEVAIPFTFYDGTNIPGGTVRVKKGDLIWVFLDKSRKVGAELGVVEESASAVKKWARVGVDDLMLVRGSIIIPHHYDFYYFLVNKAVGPGGERVFSYSADAPKDLSSINTGAGLTTAESKAAAAKALPDVSTLEGANDDPRLTKVVDRRWYQRNKHIYPASTWQDIDAEKDYSAEVRRDAGGNAFFFSR